MNELYVNECYIYFDTNKGNYDEAMDEFLNRCNEAGIEITIDRAVLRDKNGNEIN